MILKLSATWYRSHDLDDHNIVNTNLIDIHVENPINVIRKERNDLVNDALNNTKS